MIIIFILSPVFAFSETDEAVVKQAVDNSCNENNLCEVARGETIYTCPHDCHTGNINPAILQANAEAPPIEIYNIKITQEGDIITISWETNKPTDSTFVLEDGLGENEGGYLDELFITQHTAQIKNLDANKDYYFKIFAKGIYGDDNYEIAQLYAITFDVKSVLTPAEISETLEKDGISPLVIEKKTVPTIKKVEDWQGVKPKITPPAVASEKINYFELLKTVADDWWLLQVLIFLGIIYFFRLIFWTKV
ncbi:MAG: hypothetical protein ABIG87_02310 [Patescibacteria group bacterium]